MARKRRQVEGHLPLGPEDDPYLAYLIWREQRDAQRSEPTGRPDHDARPPRRSWARRLAIWRRDDTEDSAR